MDISQIQIKIDELQDWLELNPCHHRVTIVQSEKAELQAILDNQIRQIEVIEPITIKY